MSDPARKGDNVILTRRRFILVCAVLALACCTGNAFAWGPATHVEIGNTILSNLSLFPAAIAGLLASNRRAFLYGNIAADVVFAKRWSRVKQFCHHWTTAFSLLEDAQSDENRAFAYGYLSHLAADTIAHGKFVPRQIQASQCSVNFGHFYWELRGDALQSDTTWNLVGRLIRADYDDQHRLLENHITDTLLSYDMNRLLFERMNAFASRKNFRRGVGIWSRFSRHELPRTLIEAYLSECFDRVHSVLTDGTRSTVLREDPNGTSALMRLRVSRRETRRLRRIGVRLKTPKSEASEGLLPQTGREQGYAWRQNTQHIE